MKRVRSQPRPPHCRALVTGGSGEIGAAICQALADSGMIVIVHAGQRIERAQQIVAAINSNGGRSSCVQFDLTDGESTSTAMAKLIEDGPISVVVHNSGVHDDAPMAGMSASQWHHVIDVNLNGFYRAVQPTLLGMARVRWGRVIAISSVAARMGNRGQTNYAAAKAGLHGGIISLAREMGGRGVTANVIAPGLIATRMAEHADLDNTLALIPAGRLGLPGEVAALTSFLCSESAGYINGQIIGIDGGMAPG
ncbi:MAG: 3-oxoacyl-ACP reductase FabG [Wenzhouxiangellaceae bacterium]|nr:3-oxoacyl-ACP reductase FabG [Wenzhouxiangellaceae bacterium]